MSTRSMSFAHVSQQDPRAQGQPVAGNGPAREPGGLARAAWVLWAGGWRALAALVLAGLLWVLWQSLLTAPTRLRADLVRVALAPGEQLVVGRHELAAPQAAAEHLLISRLDTERWVLRNLAPAHGAEVRLNGLDQQVRAHALQAGERVYAGSAVFEVARVLPTLELRLVGTDRVWLYDGAVLKEGVGEEPVQVRGPCAAARAGSRIRSQWNRWVPAWLAVPAALSLGGEAACGLQLAIPGLPVGTAWVERKGDEFWLRAPHDGARRMCVSRMALPRGCADAPTLFEAAVDLSQVQRLWVGRTGYAVRLAEQRDYLELLPTGRVGWLARDLRAWPETAEAGAARLTLTARSHDAWRKPAWPTPAAVLPLQTDWLGAAAGSPLSLPVLAAGALGLCFAAWARLRRWGLGWPAALAMGLGVGMMFLSAAGYWLGEGLGEAWRLVLLSSACAAVVSLPARTGWAWLATVTMATMGVVGSLLQLHLGLQGVDTGAWLYFNKTASLLATVLWGLWVGAWWLHGMASGAGRWQWPPMARIEAWVAALVMVAFAAMGLQAVAGSEEGVFGLQPIELAKFTLVLLGAHALTMRLEWAHHRGWSRWRLWLRFLAPIALFMAIVGLALGLLSDYSPLVLIVVWLIGAMLAWSVAAGSAGALLLALVAVGAVFAALHWSTQPEGLAWLQLHGFYADRFQVLVDLPRHPHSGEQVQRALQLASQGGAAGNPGVAAWRVPAIQDDMLPALLLGRYGYLAGVLLWALQLAYLLAIAALGWQALRAAGPGDHRRRWLLQLGFFVTWGAAALLAGHLVLSWGTVTSALPVMGQPLPLISAAGSILVLLFAPLHLFYLGLDAAIRSLGQRRPDPISSNKPGR